MTQGAPTASRPTPQWRRVAAACWLAVWLMAACEQRLEAGTTAPPPGEPSAAAIAELIDDLGAADYHTREAAAAQLKSIGPAAVDALLAAAELAPDLEVALRARWIVDAIPLGMPHDPPEVTQLLDLLKQRRDLPHRLRVMQRLLRLDDGAGIEALARWGCVDWATTCYTALLDNARTTSAEFALAAILASEFLHEQEREAEAAACLGKLLDNTVGRADLNVDQILQQLGRDQRTVRSRMHFFESCAARARGDIPAARQAVEIALRSYAKDVDALIALYTLPDNTPDQRADAVRRINEALRQIDNEIQDTPEDANSYNEYAWLVANTQGDLDKATRYSKQSLAKSFDSASYLDTLAHCRAAAGDLKGAIRWQMLARRQEPHNRMILANLRRFQTQATAAP